MPTSQSLPNQGTRSTNSIFTILPRRHQVSIPSKSGNPVDRTKPRPTSQVRDLVSIPSKSGNPVDRTTSTVTSSSASLNPFQIREPGRPPAPHTVLKGLPTVSIPSKSGNPVDLDTKTINGKTYLSQSLPNQGTRSTSGNTEAQEGTMNSLNPFQIREPGRPSTG